MQQEHQHPRGEIALADNGEAARYELQVGGRLAAVANYRTEGQSLRFTHTEVQPQFEGQGLGSRLAQYALEDVRRRGLKAVPQCRFIARYIARHEKEFGDLVAG